jgi:hypothetical protein
MTWPVEATKAVMATTMTLVAMATLLGRRSTSIKIGVKKVAPPTPEAMAVVAMRMATGSMNQYWSVMSINQH